MPRQRCRHFQSSRLARHGHSPREIPSREVSTRANCTRHRIVFEVDARSAKAIAQVVRTSMESVAKKFSLTVPLPVKIHIGPSLSDAAFTVVQRPSALSAQTSAAATPASSPKSQPPREHTARRVARIVQHTHTFISSPSSRVIASSARVHLPPRLSTSSWTFSVTALSGTSFIDASSCAPPASRPLPRTDVRARVSSRPPPPRRRAARPPDARDDAWEHRARVRARRARGGVVVLWHRSRHDEQRGRHREGR